MLIVAGKESVIACALARSSRFGKAHWFVRANTSTASYNIPMRIYNHSLSTIDVAREDNFLINFVGGIGAKGGFVVFHDGSADKFPCGLYVSSGRQLDRRVCRNEVRIKWLGL